MYLCRPHMMSRSMSAATGSTSTVAGPDDVFHAMPAILPPPPISSLHSAAMSHNAMSHNATSHSAASHSATSSQHSTQASFSNQVYMDSKEASDLSQLNGQVGVTIELW